MGGGAGVEMAADGASADGKGKNFINFSSLGREQPSIHHVSSDLALGQQKYLPEPSTISWVMPPPAPIPVLWAFRCPDAQKELNVLSCVTGGDAAGTGVLGGCGMRVMISSRIMIHSVYNCLESGGERER